MFRSSAKFLGRTTLGVIAVLGAFAASLLIGGPASAQPASTFTDGSTTSGTDPRRLRNTSRVAGEILTDNDPAASPDERRLADEYQPKGVEMGSYLVYPEASTGMSRNNNIYATRGGTIGDWISKNQVGFRAQSRFDTHALNFSGELEKVWYMREVSNNQINARLRADGRYDLQRGTEFTAAATAYQDHEDRGSPDATGGRVPTPILGNSQSVGGKTTSGVWIHSAELNRLQLKFDDIDGNGTKIRNSLRDRSEYKVNARSAYEIFPGYYAVGVVSANKRDYEAPISLGGVNRDSQGYAGYAGAGVDLSQLVRGDFLVGYLRQDYTSPALRDPSGFAIKSSLNWTPDRQTLIVPAIDREVLESSSQRVSGILRTSFSVLARREVQRNIILTGYASVNQDKYIGTDEPSYGFEVKASITYAFTREFYTQFESGHRQRFADSTAIVAPFNQTVTTLRFGLRK